MVKRKQRESSSGVKASVKRQKTFEEEGTPAAKSESTEASPVETKSIRLNAAEAEPQTVERTEGAQQGSQATKELQEEENADRITVLQRRLGIQEVTNVEAQKHSILTEHKFAKQLHLHDKIKQAIEEMGYTYMTQIQHAAITHMLEGRDVLGQAKTGSGKTLAYVIPALNMFMSGFPVTVERGTIVLIIAPTRELVEQIYDVAKLVAKYLPHTIGAVTGGTKKKVEADHLGRGVNLLVATPGRLVDHLENTRDFVYSNLKMLVLDEADRMLEVGFQDELRKILSKLPRKGRQTALFSATVDSQIKEIATLSMKKPVFVQVKDRTSAVVEGVEQAYVHVTPSVKCSLLYRLLRKKLRENQKVMVFFSTCNSVQFHEDILNFLELPCLGLHGNKKQNQRTSIYNNFMQAEKGILLCTNVAARGLDFPGVHCIIQFDPPDTETEYIHRVGRTGRGQDSTGAGLLFLLTEEIGLLGLLQKAGVTLKEYTFQAGKLEDTHRIICKQVHSNFHLAELATAAYRSYLLAYASHAMKNIYDVRSLDLTEIAKGFGLERAPRIDLAMNPFKKERRDKKLRKR
eukprot:Blabericola_migrator_1__1888@NODE_1512_length_4373_cov_158_589178_g993_i0_p1_GENE_NODE_1512_length_4373_cov_158_589178_g993_i0NODE_1512_length_4373_cov_158_589178_g993_i0_p1_ORF_typecomplete_len574_score113_57DEAD/PF00270_29/2_3e50Helicase_C/PF00271_31/9_7e02Helicase_C/PF00271_31/1e04Helicase_C/PF00271_31/6_3e26DUF4217/PF13959_6/1_9e15ResIII/PF04851_15/6_6e13ERCC3_RAD25_C/PF16203_5/2_7e03ERCC3_RAD25_C/PF16203_5/2e11Flavi_DEAD/PF07652_14/0_0012SecA_DEAD/PF07517_14/0_0078AAA_11/PF13086_6/4_8e03AAA